MAAALVGLMLVADSAAAATTNGMIAFNTQNSDAGEPGGTYVMRADGTGVLPLFDGGPGNPVGHVEFSPDGNSVLFNVWPAGDPQPSLRTASLASNDGTRQAGGVGAGDAAWSPDSTRIVYARYVDVVGATDQVEIHTVDPDGTDDVPVITESYPCVYREFASGIFWNQVTNRIMYACGTDPTMTSINPDGTDRQSHGVVPESPHGDHGYFDFFDLSPDGTKFAGTWSNEIASWDWSGGTPVKITTDGPLDGCCAEIWASWSPDGSQVVYADEQTVGAPASIVSVSSGVETSIGQPGSFHYDWQPCVAGVTVTCEPTTLKSAPAQPPADPCASGACIFAPPPVVAPPPAPTPAGPTPFDARPVFPPRAAKQDGARKIAVKIGCDARSAEPCAIKLQARTQKAFASARKRKLLVAAGSATVQPGTSKKVRLTLTRKARKLLKRERKLALYVNANAPRSDGVRVSARTSVTMRAK